MKQFLFYGLALLVFGLGILLILEQGQKLQPSLSATPSQSLSGANVGCTSGETSELHAGRHRHSCQRGQAAGIGPAKSKRGEVFQRS